MKRFEEEIGYILTDHKEGAINYAEAVTRIEDLVLDVLGFSVAMQRRYENVRREALREKS